MNVKNIIEEFFRKVIDLDINLAECKDYKFGDYSTSIAFNINKTNPNEEAKKLVSKIKLPKEIIDKIEIKNGYINLFLSKNFIQNFILKILEKGDKFGSSNIGEGKKVLVEFVSANPTGPLNIANGRAAVFGDSLVRILNFSGYCADSEYYVNDCGRQIDLLEESAKARYYGEKEPPAGGYKGEYIAEIVKKVKNLDKIRDFLINYMVEWQRATLDKLEVKFNNWMYESDIRKSDVVKEVMQKIKNKLYEKDGAIWLKMGDKDKVLIKSDGSFTYILPDIAYHINKFNRGYDLLIDIFGPDHISHVKELKTALSCCDVDLDKLKFIIMQWVSFIRDGKKISMSKRAGEFMLLHKLIDEVGKDAVRFFLLMRRCESHLDFDIDLAKKQSEENPVYYVQYAHARICSILDKAKLIKQNAKETANLSLINTDEEILLIKKLIHFPEIVEEAANKFFVHIIPFYLIELAKIFHKFYEKHRVISDDIELTKSRLLLIKAVRQVISNSLSLIGVSAPEKM